MVYTKIIHPDISNTFKGGGGIERIFKYGKEKTRGGENDGEMRVKGRREEKARESKGWNYYYYYLFVHTVIKHEDLNVK